MTRLAGKSAISLLKLSIARQTAREGSGIRIDSTRPAFIETELLTDA